MGHQFMGLPALASAHGEQIDRMIAWVHWLMLLLFLIWGIYFIIALVRFRRSSNPTADYVGVKSHASTYLEVGLAVAETVLLVGLSIPLWAERVDNLPPEGDAVVVRVIGEQFAWNIHYPGADGVFGRVDARLVNLDTNPLGLDRDDPFAKDDIETLNQLHLPVDKPAIIRLSSKDVIHCFALQEMRIKQDAVPGMEISAWFEPIVTTEQMRKLKGNPDYNYEISCAQLCGIGHYKMKGFMTIHTQESFDAWLAAQAELLEESGGDEFWDE